MSLLAGYLFLIDLLSSSLKIVISTVSSSSLSVIQPSGSHWLLQTSVRAAVVMLLPAIMFSMSAAMMAIMIMRVSPPSSQDVPFPPSYPVL